MGQELRSIVLDDGEFRDAAGLYFDARADCMINSGNIAGVRMADGRDPDAVLEFRTPLIDGRTCVDIDRDQMIDMVVAFCRDRAIPLPRSGRKDVVRRDDQVVLEIELDWF